MIDAKRVYDLRNSPGYKGAIARFLVFVFNRVRPPAPFVGAPTLARLWKSRGVSRGVVIVLGSNCPRKDFDYLEPGKVVQVDLKQLPNVDLVADAERLSERIPSGSADLIIATSMIEHTPNPARIFAEAHKILRDGGIFYVEAPWLFPLPGLRHLSESNGFRIVDSGSVVSPHGSLYTFLSYYLPEVLSFDSSAVNYALRYVFAFLLWPFGLVERFFPLSRKRTNFFTDSLLYVFLEKPASAGKA